MKKTLCCVLALVACAVSAQAQYFTNGNLAVVRIGGPGESVTTSDNGNSIWIDQYETNGTLVNSYAIPSNGPTALIMDGEPYDGLMTLTPDGTHLVIAGFNTSAPYISNGLPANFAFTSSTNVPRAIATVDGYGNYALPIVNSNMFNTYTITSAASDGTNFWATGTGSTAAAYGLIYCGTATDPATNEVLTGVFSAGRSVNIYNGGLYLTAYPSNTTEFPQAGGFLMSDIAAGELPTNATTATQPFTTGTASASTPSDLVINSAGTIAYLADYSFGIVKYTNGGSGWVSNYTVYPTNAGYSTASGSSHAISVTADFTQTPPVVYATTGETITNRLVMFYDTGPTPTVINLASNINVAGVGGATNTFRGVRFVPGSAPAITNPPASVVVSANGTATFTVGAIGSGTLSYQWYANGVAVAGATTTSLTYDNVTTLENGTELDVVVSNGYGTATSPDVVLTVNPSYFMGGNLAVVSVGGPGQYVSSTDTGNTVSILQFTTGGTQVSTISLPTSGPEAFTLDGSATEGYMTLTPDGHTLVLGGYNAAAGTVTGGPAAATSTNVPRAVVTIDGNGNYAMPISNPNIFSTYNIRGAVFDGTNFWVTSAGAPSNPKGILYVGTAGSSGPDAVQVEIGVTGSGNERVLNLFNNSIYVSTGSSSHGIWAVPGTGFPPLTGDNTNTINTIPQPGSASGPYDFAFDPGNTTCYVADGNLGGIIKYTNNAGTWVSNYLIAPGPGTNVGGLTVDYTQNPPVLYATTLLSVAAGNQLISIVDNGASSTATVLATATASASGSNYFRGVRFVPGEPPTITSGPVSVVQDAGGDATFSVEVGGTPLYEYQWSTNGVAVAGATDSALTLTDLTTNQTGTLVSVVVTNNFGTVASSNAVLTVQQPNSPFDVTIVPPTSLTVNAGGTASFTVSAIGAGITYYWALNGVPLTDGGSILGSTTATLTISPAYATFNGTYTVLASNSFGTVGANNSATLTVVDPVIIAQPVGSTNVPGPSATAMLSVTAAGAPTLTYQWLSNGVAIAGANASTLLVANSGTIVSALYSVIVSNGLGNSITSGSTTVSFTPVLLMDDFNYPNGDLFGDAGSPWIDINGTLPELVTNGRVQVSETNATTDAQSLFSQSESGTVLWASFIINLSVLPSNPGGVYFANLEDTNFGFYGRIFTLTSNNPSLTPNIPNQAFPGTYRLGIADAQGDSAPSASSGPSAVVPLDLAPGIDYQVVFYLDLVNQVSGMAINPATVSDVTAAGPGGVSSGAATDAFTPALPMAAFGLRQRVDSTPKGEGEGVMEMDNLLVSFDWNGMGSGYPVVTSGILATNPVIGVQPVGETNFSETSYTMEVAASGIGAPGVGLTYAWYQDGLPLSDGPSLSGSATPALTLSSLAATNSGTYYCTVTGAVGGSVQSSNAVILVNVLATPPDFGTNQPAANTTNSQGGSVTFDSFATGTGPITYQWYFSNMVGVAASELAGDTNADLMLTGLTTNESGTYYVIATGDNGMFQTQSSNALLTVTGPKSVTIGYLRSLVNPVSLEPSDTTTFFNVTGVITTATNLTTGDTASYYLQDSTGGINLFVTFGADFRPALGDEVTATGTLSSYYGNLELDVSEGTSGYTNYVVGTNYPQPTPILLPWADNTAPLAPELTADVEGSVIMLTNLYFEAYTPGAVFTAGTDYTVTNNTGVTYQVYVSDQDQNLVTGQPLPQFATSIAGPLWQDDLTGPVGIEFTVYSNLVVPVSVIVPPLTNVGTINAVVSSAGGTNSFTLTWNAVSSNYTYSVWSSTNLLQPFTNLVSGLVFSNTIGTYTDPGQTVSTKYYEISSP